MNKRALGLILVGTLLIALGFASAIVVSIMLFLAPSAVPKVVVPGIAVIELEEIGNYTIFHEVVSEVDGVRYESEANLCKELDIALIHEASGDAINVYPIQSFAHYSYGDGLYAESAFRFNIDTPGTYQLEVTHFFDIDTVQAVFNVFPERPFFRKVIGVLLGLLLAVGIGLCLIVVGVINHARSDREYSPINDPSPGGHVLPPPPS